MRVIEQLARHFWDSGRLSRDEALYLVQERFAPLSAFAGLDWPVQPRPQEVEIRPDSYEGFDGHEGCPEACEQVGPCELERLQESMTSLRPGIGPRRGQRRKSVHRKLVVLRALVERCFAGQTACPTVLRLGNHFQPCSTWRKALRVLARQGNRGIELLKGHPEAMSELARCLTHAPLLVGDEKSRWGRKFLAVPEVGELRLVCRVRERLGLPQP